MSAALTPRFLGRLADLSAADRALLVRRSPPEQDAVIEQRVRAILARVASGDDATLRELCRELDGVCAEQLRVTPEDCRRAWEATASEVRAALERAASNVLTVHRALLPAQVRVEPEPGVLIVRRAEPLASVGVYAPGGRAAYPSSLLMGALPAVAAGVRRVAICSPPQRPDGLPSEVVRGAAHLIRALAPETEVELWALGGAQAIGALALGCGSVAPVCRVVGPGNAYVAEAKRQLAGRVPIDAPAGPSEILIVADETAHPGQIAAELLAQAEHDPDASVVLLALSEPLLAAVRERLVPSPDARTLEITRRAVGERAALLSCGSLDEARAFSAEYAPEHLSLRIADAEILAPSFRHAGTIFVGDHASVAFGDYMSGANHVLPTAGAARAYSGLGTSDYVRLVTTQVISEAAARSLGPAVSVLAEAEGLPQHGVAARAAGGES